MEFALDIGGPVRGEVYVVALGPAGLLLTGPCGAAPWYIETHDDAHPMQVIRGVVDDVLGGAVEVLHSTSWRWSDGAVVLTFVAVIAPGAVGGMAAEPVVRTELARGGATAAPDSIGGAQVLEHALRHLAWLFEDDAEVAAALAEGWGHALAEYTPEPFRQLGGSAERVG